MYEFIVNIWEETGQWYYSLIQSFDEGPEETLAYGTCDSQAQAVHCVSVEMRGIQIEG